MKLPEETRKALRRGEAIEHTFTQSVKRDGVYVIHTDNWTGQGHFRVIQVARGDDGWLALICFEGDPVRIPNKDGSTGGAAGAYTDFSARAMPRGDEPGPELEAVDKATQDEFSNAARAIADAKRADRKRIARLETALERARNRGDDVDPVRVELERLEAQLEEAA